MNSIFTRTSIRKYTDQKIEKHKIELMLKAAMCAPTACNQREWEFIVIEDEAKLQILSECSPYAKPAKKCAAAIVPVANVKTMGFPDYFEQDMGACCQNILLEARELGLGGVWMAVTPDMTRIENVSKVLNLPDGVKPFAIIALGYPDEDKKAREDRFEVNRIHFNEY